MREVGKDDGIVTAENPMTERNKMTALYLQPIERTTALQYRQALELVLGGKPNFNFNFNFIKNNTNPAYNQPRNSLHHISLILHRFAWNCR